MKIEDDDYDEPGQRVKGIQYENPKKCGGCNYETYTFYRLASWAAADGLCAQCFADGLIEGKREVK